MGETLRPKSLFAMPVGPPYGGMTAYTGMLRNSDVFRSGRAILFDTTPPGGCSKRGRFFYSLRNLVSLIATVRHERVEIVYFMTSGYLGFFEKCVMAMSCRLLGVKTVLHPVGSFINFYGSSHASRPLIRMLLRRLSAIIVVQRHVQAYVSQLAPRTPVWLIPNPVDCSRLQSSFRPRTVDGKVRILYLGALVKVKGILDLVEAIRTHRKQLAGAVVTVVGDGELLGECRACIRKYDLESMIELAGFVGEAEKSRCLASSHIFCLPSHSEGIPISILEAMGSGLPIVATTVGGIPSVVTNGIHGWLITPGDIAGLGRCLVHLVRGEAVRHAMGQNGFNRIREEFDIRIVAAHFIAQFNTLADGTVAAEQPAK